MGCFTVTCAISNLPIQWSEEKIRIFVVRPSLWENQHDYNSEWEVISPGFPGIYSGYGDFKSVKFDTFLQDFFDDFVEKIIPIEGRYEDESFFRKLERGKVILKNQSYYPLLGSSERRDVLVAPLYVREDSFQELINQVYSRSSESCRRYCKNKLRSMKEYFNFKGIIPPINDFDSNAVTSFLCKKSIPLDEKEWISVENHLKEQFLFILGMEQYKLGFHPRQRSAPPMEVKLERLHVERRQALDASQKRNYESNTYHFDQAFSFIEEAQYEINVYQRHLGVIFGEAAQIPEKMLADAKKLNIKYEKILSELKDFEQILNGLKNG